MAKRPMSAAGNRRPVSEYAKRAATVGGNPRFKVKLYMLIIFIAQNIVMDNNKNIFVSIKGIIKLNWPDDC